MRERRYRDAASRWRLARPKRSLGRADPVISCVGRWIPFEKTASVIRKSTIYKNPSGTGEALGHGFGLLALLERTGHALLGNPTHLMAIGGGFALNGLMSRVLVNPRTARWLAQTTQLPRFTIPNAVNQLAQMGQRMNDPDARDLAAFLQRQ